MIDARLRRLLVVFAAVLAAGCSGDGELVEPPLQELEVLPDTSDAASGTLWRALPSGWTRLRPPPFVRARAASVWTGEELFYWGGDTGSGGTYHADGAAFDPASGRWRLLPDSPLSGRTSPDAVWTGREIILWGGEGDATKSDGAAFDPRSNSWRLLADAPLGPRTPVAAVWTGKEMLVWGNAARPAEAVDGAAYDPEEDRWRELPRAPLALNQANAVWTGKEMVVYGALLDGNNVSKAKHARGIAYDPASNAWRVLPPYPLSPQASAVVWTGEKLLVWDYELEAAAYEPDADAWTAEPDLPLRFYECYPQGALAGDRVLAFHCGQAALYEIADGKWKRIASPPAEIFGRPVSAGSVVLFAGGAHEGHANALWAYKPKPVGKATAVNNTRHGSFTPPIEQRGDRRLMSVTFPDGTSAVLSYPADLSLGEMGMQPDVSFLYRADRPPRFPLAFYYGGFPSSIVVSERPLADYRTASGKAAELWEATTEAGSTFLRTGLEPTRYFVVFRVGGWIVLVPARDRAEARVLAKSLDARETDGGFVVVEASSPIALSNESGEGGGPELTIGDAEPAPGRVRVDRRDRFIILSLEDSCRPRAREMSESGKYASLCFVGGDNGPVVNASIYGDRDFVVDVFEGLGVRQIRAQP